MMTWKGSHENALFFIKKWSVASNTFQWLKLILAGAAIVTGLRWHGSLWFDSLNMDSGSSLATTDCISVSYCDVKLSYDTPALLLEMEICRNVLNLLVLHQISHIAKAELFRSTNVGDGCDMWHCRQVEEKHLDCSGHFMGQNSYRERWHFSLSERRGDTFSEDNTLRLKPEENFAPSLLASWIENSCVEAKSVFGLPLNILEFHCCDRQSRIHKSNGLQCFQFLATQQVTRMQKGTFSTCNFAL